MSLEENSATWATTNISVEILGKVSLLKENQAPIRPTIYLIVRIALNSESQLNVNVEYKQTHRHTDTLP